VGEESASLVNRPASAQPPVSAVKPQRKANDVGDMLWAIFAFLLVLWVLGLATSYSLGGFIHILLVLAVITVLIRAIQGRRIG
jgi:predicted ferric reductase